MRLLVIDDDQAIRRLFEQLVAPKLGVTVETAPGGDEGLARLDEARFDLVLVDLRMPRMGGLEVIRRVRKLPEPPPVVMMTAFGSIENAVEAVRLGAWDYLVKPFKLAQVERILDRVRKPTAEAGVARVPGLIGETEAMQRVHAWAAKMRNVDSNALIVGESGTGKELVARALHFEGARRAGPFVTADCGAISPDLLESELFGHVRGAFTGAAGDREGLFGRADGGTIFLDEIGDLPAGLQGTLLRAIEERRVRPVGATAYRTIDVRIVAATNRRLDDEVEAGRFRRDLFYRINVVSLEIPPLRRRKDDIPRIVEHVLARRGLKIDTAAMHALLRYDWPGNVRELRHAVERAALMAPDRIEAAHLPAEVLEVARLKAGAGGGRSLRERESDMLRTLLIEQGGDTARVAAILGIDRSTVYRKARRYGIDIKKAGRA